MNASNYHVRRATLDDMGALKSLWQSMRLPATDLEKRLTEFQVAETPDGKIVGAWGFQMTGRHGRIHSEAFSDFGAADVVRPLFWARLQSLTMNHGILRLWTQENVPFWTHNGFQPADAAALEKLPITWDRTASGWLTLKLKDEEALVSLDKEFAMFMESEKQRSSQILDQARTLKTIVTVFVLLATLAMFGLAVYFYLRWRGSAPVPP